jgi:hypothetical protein
LEQQFQMLPGKVNPAKGYLYLDGLYIEEVQPHWPGAAKARGWITDDLGTLERKLYDWVESEKYSAGDEH